MAILPLLNFSKNQYTQSVNENKIEVEYVQSIVEQLNKLPEPWKTQALYNHKEFFKKTSQEHKNLLHKRNYDLKGAINSFTWDSTPEKSIYWGELYESII